MRDGMEKKNMPRRTLLTGVAATGILAAAKRVFAQSYSAQETPPDVKRFAAEEERWSMGIRGKAWIEYGSRQTAEFIKSKRGRFILHQGSNKEIETLLLSLSGVLQEEVAESNKDPVKHFSLFPTFLMNGNNRGAFLVTNGPEPQEIMSRDTRDINPAGNAFRIDDDLIMTNEHVAREYDLNIQTLGTVYTGASRDIDVSVLYVRDHPERQSLEGAPVLHLTRKRKGELLAERVTLAGIDPDKMALPDGTKRFMSLMIPATAHIIKYLKSRVGSRLPDFFWRRMEKSFIMLVSPGSWIHLDLNLQERDAPGISGSPALLDNGDVAGIVTGGFPLEIGGAMYGIVVVHAIPDILDDMPKDFKRAFLHLDKYSPHRK